MDLKKSHRVKRIGAYVMVAAQSIGDKIMSCDVTRFTPDIVHSYPKLYDYLSGSRTDEHVCSQVLEAGRYPESHWMGAWRVFPQVISEAFQVYFSIFARAMSYLCYTFHYFSDQLKRWSYQLDILAEIALLDPQLSGYWNFGSDFLAPSINCYSLDAADLYLQPPLAKKDIQDKKVRRIISPGLKQLGYDENNGCCVGESRWFLRHYFKTRDFFKNHRDQMQALGKQFSWGAPPQAALIQKMCLISKAEELLGIVVDWNSAIKIKGDPTARNNAKNSKIIADNFQNLQPGAYLILTSNHAMAFVCVEEGLGYFFEPNLGTVAIHDQAGYEKLAERILLYQPDKKEKKKKKDPQLCLIVEVHPSP